MEHSIFADISYKKETLLKYTSKEGLTEQTELEFRAISKCIRFRWYPARRSREGKERVPDSGSPRLPRSLLLPPRWKRQHRQASRQNAIL